MNNKILWAALGLISAGSMQAGLAQTPSNVTLYGVADVGLQFYKSPNGNVAREQAAYRVVAVGGCAALKIWAMG